MPLQVSRIRAVLFDVDGTLSDTDDMFLARIVRILQPVRFLFRKRDPQPAARRFVMWAEAPANFLMGIPDTLGLDDEIAAVVERLTRGRQLPLRNFMLVPGVKDMLQVVAARYPLAVVSARDEKSTLAFLDQFGLTPLFKVIVTALSARHTKPYPDPIFFAAKALGVPPESCLMVGDTTVDIRSGQKAGAQTVGVLCGFGEEPELRKRGAGLILESTSDLVNALDA